MRLRLNKPQKLLVLLINTLILCAGAGIALAQTAKTRPEIWLGPPSYENGRCFCELFEKPDEWPETRSLIDVLFYADHNLKRDFPDDEVRKIELACRQRKLPFSLIYWASDLPALECKGMADESMWYLSIMHQGAAYAMVDGGPDQLVVQSWLKSGNPKSLPETAPWTFTRSARDFLSKFEGSRTTAAP